MKFKLNEDNKGIIGSFLFAVWIIIRLMNKLWLGDTKLDIIGYVAVLAGWFVICTSTKPIPRWQRILKTVWLTILTLGTLHVIYDSF